MGTVGDRSRFLLLILALAGFAAVARAQGPTVPTLLPEPAWTPADSNTVAWSDESAGGAVAYRAQAAMDSLFTAPFDSTGWITSLEHTFTALPGDSLVWYRVRAIDLVNEPSAWSAAVSSRQDAETPVSFVEAITVPMPGYPFAVSFGAVDTLSGVAQVDLYYALEGDAPMLYASASGDTTVMFDPPFGPGSYAFTAQALDASGNLEPLALEPHQTVVAESYPWVDVAPLDGSGVGNDGNTRAMSTVDWDDDGDPDMFISNRVLWSSPGESNSRLFRNDGPDAMDPNSWLYTDVTTSNLMDPTFYSQGVAWGDYDGDGDLDLYAANMQVSASYPAPNRLFRNDGNGVFTDIAAAAGVDEGGSGRSSSWVDFDQDGDLDLYHCQNGINRLWRNDGPDALNPDSWLFTEIGAAAGVDDPQYTMGCSWTDYDNDGDPDLFTANFHGDINRLFRNDGPDSNNVDGWLFTDVAPELGLDDTVDGMAPVWGDFDNDGWQDLYVSSRGPNRLYRNLGGTAFVEIAADSGENMNDGQYGAGTAWADFDNDGDLDLFSGTHFPESGPEWAENFLWRNEGTPGVAEHSWTFTDVTPPDHAAMGDTLNTNGVAWCDFDGDGDQDLAYATMSGGRNRLFRNDVANRTDNHWFQVDLRDFTCANTTAIGARVIVYHPGGRALREVDGGSGFLSQSSLTLHFGLGQSAVIDSVVIRWPDGQTELQRYHGVDTRVTIERGVTSDAPQAPAALLLAQNYPNPFNPSTRIAFALPADDRARLTVHDLAGRLIAVLVDEDLPAGGHAVDWHGRTRNGAPAPAGVYLYRLETSRGARAGRMLLVK
ncbi:MAG TPA: FG-GAP-like repeat-containing protein [Candidatus Krumholzibacteria bacterium]|nr:FG-GAP-like repeat-containing protein [Candidatus Krumholzibacteria bacterium]HRX51974.1 FG-GAP-like repeat-containing protein [Candidatus Krumholzibacteria bacterium]